MVMIYSQAEVQDQQSVGFEDRVETNGQTEVNALPPSLLRLVLKPLQSQSHSGVNMHNSL